MAAIPTYLFIGNSNMDGISSAADIPTADFDRWFNRGAWGTYATQADFSTPGVRMWQLRLPSASASVRTITAVPAVNQVTFDGSALNGDQINSWLYIRSNTPNTNNGQHRRITAGTGTNTATVSANWSPGLAANGTVELWSNTHTADAVPGTTTTINKIPATTTDFGAGVVGRKMVVLSGAQIGVIRTITAQTIDQITVSPAMPGALAAGDGFRVLTTANTAETIAAITAASAIRDLNYYLDRAQSFNTGFEYGNWKTGWLAHPIDYEGDPTINCVPEVMWQIRAAESAKPLGMVFAIPACTLAPQDVNTALAGLSLMWGTDITHLDWHPASPTGLYVAWQNALLGLKAAAIAEGNTIDVRGVFSMLVENDAQGVQEAQKVGEGMESLRDAMRNYIVAQGCTSLPAPKIPWIMAGVATTCGFSSVVNPRLAQIAADDVWSGYVDTSSKETLDGVHWTTPSQIEIGQSFYSKILEVQKRANDALAVQADLPTLANLRIRVKRRYERSAVSNDATNTQVDMFLNDSIREIVNTMGDTCWFARRIETMTLDGAYPATLTLPRVCLRLLRIEQSGCPGQRVTWKGLGYTDQGRLQVTIRDGWSGPFQVHFIQETRDLTVDNDVAIIPPAHIELLVLLTCKRLSECSGNSSMAMYYAAESARLWRDLKRDALRFDRMRQEGFATSDLDDVWRNGSTNDSPWGI